MIDKEKITRHVICGIRDGLITTEEEAREVASRYISDDEPSYEITINISDLLPKTIKNIITTKKFKHPYFRGNVTNIIFEDIWGRFWSRTKGVISPDSRLRHSEKFGYSIDAIGGMMWRSKGGNTFICEYRVENPNESGPETFIG